MKARVNNRGESIKLHYEVSKNEGLASLEFAKEVMIAFKGLLKVRR